MFTLNCRGRLLTINKPIVMGIINVTPDSFYSGSRKNSVEEALGTAKKMIDEGVTILDIGGQSTRPSSEKISAREELERISAVIKEVRNTFPQIYISVDTYYASVASAAVNEGADIVNDISGGFIDKEMLHTVASLKVPYICMHMKGTPQNMQQNPSYENVTREVLDYFIERIDTCTKAGLHDIIVDPGFGFGKTIQHNFQLLKDLHLFKILQKPLLLGISRKSTVYKTLGITPEQALNGSTVLHTIGLLNGANIIRTHDVKEAIEAIKLCNVYKA